MLLFSDYKVHIIYKCNLHYSLKQSQFYFLFFFSLSFIFTGVFLITMVYIKVVHYLSLRS